MTFFKIGIVLYGKLAILVLEAFFLFQYHDELDDAWSWLWQLEESI